MNKSVTRALALAILVACAQVAAGQSAAKQPAGAAAAAKRYELVPAPLRAPNAPAVPAHPSPYNFPNVQYPRIEADSSVTFQFNAPDAQKVQVSLANVPFDMVKGSDGVWTYTSAPQAPGYHNYWMIVDGAIVLDPGTNAFIGYSHMCNGFEVPEPGVDVLRPQGRAARERADQELLRQDDQFVAAHLRVHAAGVRRRTRPRGTRCCICSTAGARTSGSGLKWGGPT